MDLERNDFPFDQKNDKSSTKLLWFLYETETMKKNYFPNKRIWNDESIKTEVKEAKILLRLEKNKVYWKINEENIPDLKTKRNWDERKGRKWNIKLIGLRKNGKVTKNVITTIKSKMYWINLKKNIFSNLQRKKI